MNTISKWHFGKGSIMPSIPNDKQARLYSMRFCPFAHRLHLVLNAKEIPYHVIYINPSEQPEWYLELNPKGKVPALQFFDESPIPLTNLKLIPEYLDRKYPKIKLYPDDPSAKARTKLLIDRFGIIVDAFHQLVFNFNLEEDTDNLLNTLYTAIDEYERELVRLRTQYFSGRRPGILDYTPWFERIGILSAIVQDKFHFDDRFPQLATWTLLIREQSSAVREHMISTVAHTKFALSCREGRPNYDLLIEEACSNC